MAFTQADLDAIDQAIASGVLRVQFADRSVTYQSIADLLQARSIMAAQIAAANGTPVNRQYRVWTRSGW